MGRAVGRILHDLGDLSLVATSRKVDGGSRRISSPVTSIDWLCSFALMPLGLALTGPAVDAVGESTVLVTGIAVQAATVCLLLLVPGIGEFVSLVWLR